MVYPDTKPFIRYTSLAGLSALMALVQWADFWLVCTSVLSLIGGLYGLGILLKFPGTRFNFFLLGAVVIVLASTLGMLFGFLSMSWVSYDIWAITVDYAHTTPADLALAQAYATMFALVLWLLGNRLHRSGLLEMVYHDVEACLTEHKRSVLVLVVMTLVCQAYLISFDVVVYGGKALANEGEPTHPLLSLITPLVPVLPFTLAYYVRSQFRAGRWIMGFLCVVLLLVELGWFFLFGRRSILYFFILLLTGFGYGNIVTIRTIAQHIVPICISLILLLMLADTYHKLRTVYGFDRLQRMNIVDGVAGLQHTDDEKYGRIRTMNIAVRSVYSSLALGQFVNLFRTTAHEPLAGRVLLNSIILATPSDFIVDKKSILAKEALYESAYSLPLTDISETLYLEAFIDFGWLGCLVYAGFLFSLFYLIYLLAYHSRNPLFSLIVSCLSVSLALAMVEIDIITFLANIRTLLVYYLVTIFFFRKKDPHPSGYETAEKPETTPG